MERDYSKPPDFNDKTKWLELEAKREVYYGQNKTGITVPILEIKYYREIKCGKNGAGLGMAYVFFNQEAAIIRWDFPTEDGKDRVGYMALRMQNQKWAISNILINGISIEEDERVQIMRVQIYINAQKATIIFKAKVDWCIRKIKKLP